MPFGSGHLDGGRWGGERGCVVKRLVWVAVLAFSGCIGIDLLNEGERSRVAAFDFYWQELAGAYPFFGKDHVDWHEVRRQYRAATPFAERPHEFHHLITGMLSELRDPHVSYKATEEQWAENGVAPTSLLDQHGFELMLIEGRLHVIGWPGGESPELPQGLPHSARFPELWRVAGFHVVTSLVSNLMLGPPNSPVELQLRWNDDLVTRHVVHRPQPGTKIQGGLLRRITPGGSGAGSYDDGRSFAYISLNTLSQELPVDTVDLWLDAAREKDGLVLDLRSNLGGNMGVAQRLLGRFVKKPAEFVFAVPDESTTAGLFTFELFVRLSIQPRGKRYDKPIVVLTSSLTASMAEHMARILQRECGAIVIGERTAGAEAGIERARGPNGGLLKYGQTRIVDRTGVGLQAEGVVPDISIRIRVRDVAAFGPNRAATDWEERMFEAATRTIKNLAAR